MAFYFPFQQANISQLGLFPVMLFAELTGIPGKETIYKAHIKGKLETELSVSNFSGAMEQLIEYLLITSYYVLRCLISIYVIRCLALYIIYTRVITCIYIYVHIHIHTYIYIHIIYMYIYICTYTYIYICIYIYTNIYKYIYTPHIHIYIYTPYI